MNEIAQSTPEELLKKVKEDDTFKAADVTPDTENAKKVGRSGRTIRQIKAIYAGEDITSSNKELPDIFDFTYIQEQRERVESTLQNPELHTPHSEQSAKEFGETVDEVLDQYDVSFKRIYNRIKTLVEEQGNEFSFDEETQKASFSVLGMDFELKVLNLDTFSINGQKISMRYALHFIVREALKSKILESEFLDIDDISLRSIELDTTVRTQEIVSEEIGDDIPSDTRMSLTVTGYDPYVNLELTRIGSKSGKKSVFEREYQSISEIVKFL